MKTQAYAVLLYSLFIICGGIIGFIKANSTASLIMSSTFGLLLISFSFGMLKDSFISKYSAGVLIVFLTFFFLYRFSMTYTFMPAGLLSILSVITFSVLITRKHDKKIIES